MLPGDYPASTSAPCPDGSLDMLNLIGKNSILNPYKIVLPADTRCLEANRKLDLVRASWIQRFYVSKVIIVVHCRSHGDLTGLKGLWVEQGTERGG